MTDEMNPLIAELNELRLPELRERYRLAVGTETRCPNRTFLIRSICNALRPTEPAGGSEQPAPPTALPADEPFMLADEDVEVLDEDDAEPTADEAEDRESLGAAGTATEAADEPPAAAVQTPDRPKRAGTPKVAGPPVERQPRGRFSSMTVEELQAKYREVVQRDTGSSSRAYLVWKIREAEKGRVPVGPRAERSRATQPADVRVLPLRLEADVVEAMDEAWRSRGMKTRMQFLRRALEHYLEALGATEVAAKFAANKAG